MFGKLSDTFPGTLPFCWALEQFTVSLLMIANSASSTLALASTTSGGPFVSEMPRPVNKIELARILRDAVPTRHWTRLRRSYGATLP